MESSDYIALGGLFVALVGVITGFILQRDKKQMRDLARDKTSLDIFWLQDKSLTDLDNLPDPDILAAEIIENIEAGLNSFWEIMETINGETE